MRRDIEIRQHDRQDCAAACLASVCAHYGLRLPLISFRDACGTDQQGASLQGLADACSRFGLESKAMKSETKDLSALYSGPFPFILHVQKENGWFHFLTVYEMKEGRLRIMDPETGRLSWENRTEIGRIWSGYLLFLTPGKNFKKEDRRTDVKRKILKLIKLNGSRLASASACTLAYILITLSTSIFLQQIIDDILPGQEFSRLTVLCILMILLAAASAAAVFARSSLLMKAGIRTDRNLLSEYMKRLFMLPISFFDSRSSGELNSRISDAYKIRNFITGRLMLITASLMIILFSSAILLFFQWRLALPVLCTIPLYGGIYMAADRYNRKINRRTAEESAGMEEISIESISTVRAIQYFGAENHFLDKIQHQFQKYAAAAYKGGMANSAFNALSEGISRMTSILIVTAGAGLIFKGMLSIGELVSFFAIAGYLSGPVAMLVESSRDIADARIAAERISDITDLHFASSEECRKDIPKGRNDLVLENLSFSFPGRKRLIENLSLRFRCGKITLIRGENGCGKSTLAALIMKGYVPDSGRILIGETDIAEIPTAVWRRHVTLVPQKPDIFNGTLLENITMDDDGGELESVAAVCMLAGAENMLRSLPEGLMSVTGEQGRRLSGGEKQKIAFARALYRRPSFLILDEAGTCLDTESRKKMFETLEMLKSRHVTIIMISHDDAAVRYADEIIDLKNTEC